MTIRSLSRSFVAPAALLSLATLSTSAFAQEAPAESGGVVGMEDEEEDAALDEAAPAGEAAPAAGAAPAEGAEHTSVADAHESGPGTHEPIGAAPGRQKGASQLLIGGRYRMVGVPGSLIRMFGVEGGRGVLAHTFGGEVGAYWGETADGFIAMLGVFGGKFDMEPTPFRDGSWEIIESDLSATFITIDAMWDHKLVDRVSLDVGLGVGIGIVGGTLTRDESIQVPDGTDGAIQADSDAGWPTLMKCNGPGPTPFGTNCPEGDYGEADKWPVYPWINFQMGVRYQPIDEFVGRLDFGIGSTGLWVGLGADYAHFL